MNSNLVIAVTGLSTMQYHHLEVWTEADRKVLARAMRKAQARGRSVADLRVFLLSRALRLEREWERRVKG